MGRLAIIFSCFLCSCMLGRSGNGERKVEGLWDMVEVEVYKEPSHMVGPVGWRFKAARLSTSATSYEKKYGYEIKNDTIRIYPLEGEIYDDFDKQVLLSTFSIRRNGGTMKLRSQKAIFVLVKQEIGQN